ncbi:MAG: MotA/TolQ/ExbB proton channel family protein [Deltaproteobacteria bacterium]|nr:MotA/TolQ/ExbB proton channel family protein [Deltaproteobacteria bacterium]
MQDFSLMHMWESMGFAVKLNTIFMVILSIWSIYVIVERLITYAKATKQTYQFVLSLRNFLGNHDHDSALAMAKQLSGSPVAKSMDAALTVYSKSMHALQTDGPQELGEFDIVDSVNRALERTKEREQNRLKKGLGGLATIASITPFVGLFGTVLGIINAFKLLEGGGGIEVVGPGIAEALVSTAFGLLVAIPAAMFFNYFSGRVDNMLVDMNDVSSEFVDYVLKEGRQH